MRKEKLDILKKGVVYGGNYIARLLGNLGNSKLNLGHPYSALGFSIADMAFGSSDKTQDCLANRLVKLGGTAYFSTLSVKNLIEFIQGDYSGLKDFPFSLSMAVSLGSDLKNLYSQTGKSFSDDSKNLYNLLRKKKK